ncbi:hypothetical protein HU200_026347 [Digitaria exilis]|uniref:Uncharacterized protein n=1 Tax=Digitaria exilis TaxID=1010633 RepID=A0A835BWE2_9POAL|nr:hypothetical protein HU200_026347 [Digitaria exilis]
MEVKCRRLEGKVAVVTASTQGIGLAIAERLGLEGAAVVISSRKQKNVDEAVEGLKAKGITVVGGRLPRLRRPAAQEPHRHGRQEALPRTRKDEFIVGKALALTDAALNENFGHIDILVSNAAANPTVDDILATKESDAAPYLRKGSSVIIISSITGYNPEQGLAMYGVTKTALFGLTKALAREMGPNTRVNCIAPGFVSYTVC